MWFVTLRVPCPGPMLRLFSGGGGGGPVAVSPCLAQGCLSPRGWVRMSERSGARWGVGEG